MCWVCIYIYCIYKTGPGSGPADVYIHTNSKDIHNGDNRHYAFPAQLSKSRNAIRQHHSCPFLRLMFFCFFSSFNSIAFI